MSAVGLFVKEVCFMQDRKRINGLNEQQLVPGGGPVEFFIGLFYSNDSETVSRIEDFKYGFSKQATHWHNMGPAFLYYKDENVRKAIVALHKMNQITKERFISLSVLADQYECHLGLRKQVLEVTKDEIDCFNSTVDHHLLNLDGGMGDFKLLISCVLHLTKNDYRDEFYHTEFYMSNINDIKGLKDVVYGSFSLASLLDSMPPLKFRAELFVTKSLEFMWQKFPHTSIRDRFLTELELRAYVLRSDYSHPADMEATIISLSQQDPAWRPAPFQFTGFSNLVYNAIVKLSDSDLQVLLVDLESPKMSFFKRYVEEEINFRKSYAKKTSFTKAPTEETITVTA